MAEDVRLPLSAALAPIHAQFAHLAADPSTEIDLYPTPFLQRYRIYQVKHFARHKPIRFFVGFAPGEPAYLLTADPSNFVQMCKADRVRILSPALSTLAEINITSRTVNPEALTITLR